MSNPDPAEGSPAEGSTLARKPWLLWLPLVLLPIAGFVVAYLAVDPAPPRTLRVATGSKDGAYHRYALRYQEALLERGLTLELRTTHGSAENLQLLESGEVDLAFVQGGVSNAKEHPRLRSLGSVYREPLWVFTRGAPPADLRGLKGKRLAVGTAGSGTRAIAVRLLKDCKVDAAPTELLELGSEAAAAALRKGEVDALFLTGSPEIPLIQELLRDPSLQLMPWRRANAHARHHRYLSRVVLFEGVVDVAANHPAQDVPLVASAATLVITDEFHPSLGDLVLLACKDVHEGGGTLEAAGEFPSALYVDYPLTRHAKRFHAKGLPLLYRYLPFWVASVIARFWVMLLPLLTLLLPLSRIVPPAYAWRQQSKILKLYERLHGVERAASDLDDETLGVRLQAVRDYARKVRVANSYRDRLHTFWMHLGAAEERLRERIASARAPEPSAPGADEAAPDAGPPPGEGAASS